LAQPPRAFGIFCQAIEIALSEGTSRSSAKGFSFAARYAIYHLPFTIYHR
jgi:hypothetical protein